MPWEGDDLPMFFSTKRPSMSNVNAYRTLAVLANVQELVCRVLEETGGNDFSLVSQDEMAQDVAACINHCVGGVKGATA